MVLNQNNLWVISALIAASVGLLMWWYTTHSNLSLQDQQNQRSLHQGKTLTGGGLFMFLPIIVVGMVLFPAELILYVIFLLSLVGFIDDKYDLPFQFRLLVQITATLVTLYYFSLITPIWVAVFLGLSLMWWVNLFNFMDGANGMAALHGLVSVAFYGFYYSAVIELDSIFIYLLLCCCWVFIIYLFFNMWVKNLFMGDSGSLPMAWVLAILALYGLATDQLNVMQIAVVHAVFIVDTTLTLIMRIRKKENITQAHATHIYQRLIKSGHSHNQISIAYACITVLSCLLIWLTVDCTWLVHLLMFFAVYLTLAILFMKYLIAAR